jgi:hypothetical protein
MPVGIGASTIVGLALETTPNTYLAPTKYIPLLSENLNWVQDINWRRPLRQMTDPLGAVPGNAHVEGDLTMEALDDVIPYFLDASRGNLVKTGTGPFVYTFTPNTSALPGKTLSLTIVRNGIVFGYVGCVVSSFTFTLDNGMLRYNVTVMGSDEATQATPTPVWPTSVPYGMGMYTYVVAGSTITDADTFEFQNDDNASPEYRLRGGGVRGASYIRYGERSASIKSNRDFTSRTDYDAYKTLTSQTLSFTATNGTASIALAANAVIKDTYDITLGGQGDLVRASLSYTLAANASGIPYTIAVTTPETFTP